MVGLGFRGGGIRREIIEGVFWGRRGRGIGMAEWGCGPNERGC